MWVKSKFALWQPRYYNLLTVKNNKKIHVFEVLIFFYFLKTYRYCQSEEIRFKHHPYPYIMHISEIYFVKFNYFSGRPNNVTTLRWY